MSYHQSLSMRGPSPLVVRGKLTSRWFHCSPGESLSGPSVAGHSRASSVKLDGREKALSFVATVALAFGKHPSRVRVTSSHPLIETNARRSRVRCLMSGVSMQVNYRKVKRRA